MSFEQAFVRFVFPTVKSNKGLYILILHCHPYCIIFCHYLTSYGEIQFYLYSP